MMGMGIPISQSKRPLPILIPLIWFVQMNVPRGKWRDGGRPHTMSAVSSDAARICPGLRARSVVNCRKNDVELVAARTASGSLGS